MDLIIITGPQAVGKMTVGYELEKLINFPLFHNHMSIDLISPIFPYGSEIGSKLVHEFRFRVFEEVAKSKNTKLIFTYLWAFSEESDGEYIQDIINIFEKEEKQVGIVELETSLEERLIRNKSDFRLEKKISKRNIKSSETFLLHDYKQHRLNSLPGEVKHPNYLRIDNTNITPQDTALEIKKYFNLKMHICSLLPFPKVKGRKEGNDYSEVRQSKEFRKD